MVNGNDRRKKITEKRSVKTQEAADILQAGGKISFEGKDKVVEERIKDTFKPETKFDPFGIPLPPDPFTPPAPAPKAPKADTSPFSFGGETFTDFKDFELAKNLAGIPSPSLTGGTPSEKAKRAALASLTQRGITNPELLSNAQLALVNAEIEEEKAKISRERPERRELDPDERFGAGVPVVGGFLRIEPNLLLNLMKSGVLGKRIQKAGRDFEKAGILDPEVLRTEALTEIERQVFEEGITASETFGTFSEASPFGLPSVLEGIVNPDLIEEPFENIEEILKDIRKEKRRATKYETWSSGGTLNPLAAKESIEDIELNIQRLESRIKLLTNFSSKLNFNTDRVNTIETEILSAKEIVHAAKLLALDAQKIGSNDADIIAALKSLNEGIE